MRSVKIYKEQWCPACDISSRERTGQFIITTWYCEKCIEGCGLKVVPKDEANKIFRKMREVLRDE